MATQKKTVALVEDDKRLQEDLVEMLGNSPDIECVFATGSPDEALAKIPKIAPDVVVMDINLSGKSGIDCIAELRAKLPDLEIVMLTAYAEEEHIFRAFKEGASGYLLKSSTPEEIRDAIRDVYSGGAPFSSAIARKVVKYFRAQKEVESDNEKLSFREREVLELLASGYIYKEVADKLDLTIETVKTYVKRICKKLQVRGKANAILKYRS